MNVKEVPLGERAAFTRFPAEVKIEHDEYFLVQNEDAFRLMLAVCPHAGGPIVEQGDHFYCPFHMWSFDQASGECLNVRGAALECYDVVERDGQFVALM